MIAQLKDMLKSRNECDYESLVAKMITIQDLVSKSKKETDPKVETIEQMAERNMVEGLACRGIEDVVTSLSHDSLQLAKFAYQLRKIDTDNTYSLEFLNGNVQPSILVDVIMSNQYKKVSDTMEATKSYFLIQDQYYLSGDKSNKQSVRLTK